MDSQTKIVKVMWIEKDRKWIFLDPERNDAFLNDFNDCEFFRGRIPGAPKDKISCWELVSLKRRKDLE